MQASPDFTHCSIRNNAVSGINHIGAGIYVDGGSPIFAQSNILDNHAQDWASGGGVYCEGNSTALFERCLIKGNSPTTEAPASTPTIHHRY